VLNQICGHWLPSGALHFVVTKTWELCDEVVNLAVPGNMGDLETNVFDTELEELMVHMKSQVLEFFQPFLSFLHGLRKRRVTIC
jgi:hypothetical protein